MLNFILKNLERLRVFGYVANGVYLFGYLFNTPNFIYVVDIEGLWDYMDVKLEFGAYCQLNEYQKTTNTPKHTKVGMHRTKTKMHA